MTTTVSINLFDEANNLSYILSRRISSDRKYILNIVLRSSPKNLCNIRLKPQVNTINIFYGYLGQNSHYLFRKKDNFNLLFLDHPPFKQRLGFRFFRIIDDKLNNLMLPTSNSDLLPYLPTVIDYARNCLSTSTFTTAIYPYLDLATQPRHLYIKESCVLDTLMGGQLCAFAYESLLNLDSKYLATSSKPRIVCLDTTSLKPFVKTVDTVTKTLPYSAIDSVVCPNSMLGLDFWLRGIPVIAHPSSYIFKLDKFHSQRTDNNSLSSRLDTLEAFLPFSLFSLPR